MTIDEALSKGFLNLSEDEVEQILNDLFDKDDPVERFENGLALMQTVVPEKFVGPFLDLANIVIEANDELEEGEEEEEEDDHAGHNHPH